MNIKEYKKFFLFILILLIFIGCKSNNVKIAIVNGKPVYISKKLYLSNKPTLISQYIDNAVKNKLLMIYAKQNDIYDMDQIKNFLIKQKKNIAYSYLINKIIKGINVTQDEIKTEYKTNPIYENRNFDGVKDLIKQDLKNSKIEKKINEVVNKKYRRYHVVKINKKYLDFKKFNPEKTSLVIATIDNNVKITNNMLKNRMDLKKESEDKALEYLINISILRLESKKYINSKYVNEKIKKLHDEMILNYMRNNFIFSKYPINSKTLKEFYEKHKKDFFSEPEKVKVRHILFKDEATAKKILKEILNSKNPQKTFFKYARLYAPGPEALKENAGDLGEIPYKAMPEAFSKAAFSLKKGEIYKKPVKTIYGYHLIMCEYRVPPKIYDLKKNFNKVLEKMKEYIKITKYNEFLHKLAKEYKLKILYKQYKGEFKNG